MTPIAIADSSPLIALSRIHRLDLLKKQFHEILVPEIVASEVGELPDWIKVRTIAHPTVIDLLPRNIHRGEAEVLVLASEVPEAILILDDRYARDFARSAGYHIVGTVGLILRAKREQHIPAGMPLLSELCLNGFRISDELLAEAKRLLNE